LAGPSWQQLGHFFPGWAPAAVEVESPAQAHPVLARFLRSWGERQPWCLILDDCHWSDPATLDLVPLLCSHLEGARGVLVFACRPYPPEMSETAAAVFDRLAAVDQVRIVDLAPLGPDEVADLAGHLLEARPQACLVDAIYAATAGVPFFVVELARHLRLEENLETSGEEVSASASTDLSAIVTTGTQSLVLNRIRSLGGPSADLAGYFAVCGTVDVRSPAFHALPTILGLDPMAAAGAVDELVRSDLLRLEGQHTLGFSHPILRSAVYEAMGFGRRRELHAAVADQLMSARRSGRSVALTEVAHHVAASAQIGDGEAIAIVVAAGDEVLKRAPAVAAVWYERALALVGPADAELHGELAARLARGRFLSDQLDGTITAVREALEHLGPGQRRAAVTCVAASALTAKGQLHEALALIDEAMQAAPNALIGRLRAHRCSILLYMGRLAEAAAEGKAALALTDTDLSAKVLALRELAQTACWSGRLAEHRRLHRQACQVGEALPAAGRVPLLALAGTGRAMVGDLDEGSSILAEAQRLCRESEARAYQPMIDQGMATVHWLRGDWDAAVAAAEAAMEGAVHGGRVVEAAWLSPILITIDIDRGHLRTAGARLAAVARAQDETGYSLSRPLFVWNGARLERLAGDPAAAVETLGHLVDDLLEREVLGIVGFPLQELVHSCVDVGARKKGQTALRRLDEVAEATASPYAAACADLARLQIAGDLDAGRASLERFGDLGSAVDVARAQMEIGRVAGEPELLVQAYRFYEGVQADLWRRRVVSTLKALGQPVPRARRRKAPGFSLLEQDVVRLAGEGLTNRRIALALAMSTKTVESYISRILRKTGYTSRTQLAAALASGELAFSSDPGSSQPASA
ncbi:MAG TPA: LuxR C-terminal-related transcriptional regulator, partial [Acidimicrobiales bacterium]|nr:LuxR C-terminal-related transcriptional regulator [Acidimicrobiales bacterium]